MDYEDIKQAKVTLKLLCHEITSHHIASSLKGDTEEEKLESFITEILKDYIIGEIVFKGLSKEYINDTYKIIFYGVKKTK